MAKKEFIIGISNKVIKDFNTGKLKAQHLFDVKDFEIGDRTMIHMGVDGHNPYYACSDVIDDNGTKKFSEQYFIHMSGTSEERVDNLPDGTIKYGNGVLLQMETPKSITQLGVIDFTKDITFIIDNDHPFFQVGEMFGYPVDLNNPDEFVINMGEDFNYNAIYFQSKVGQQLVINKDNNKIGSKIRSRDGITWNYDDAKIPKNSGFWICGQVPYIKQFSITFKAPKN